jgi:hypothetical protein
MPSYDQGTAVTGAAANVYYGSYTVNTAATLYVQPVIYGTCVTSYVTFGAPETEEQRIEREQRQRDEAAKENARRERAKQILVSVLTKEQQEQFEKERHFELQVNSRLYRVRPGSRVERLDPKTKQILSYFCIHEEAGHDLPSEDRALGQKLLLEANEQEFLRIANETKAVPDCTPDEIQLAA